MISDDIGLISILLWACIYYHYVTETPPNIESISFLIKIHDIFVILKLSLPIRSKNILIEMLDKRIPFRHRVEDVG